MKSLGGNELAKNLLGYFQLNYDYLTDNQLYPIFLGLHFYEGELKKYKWQPDFTAKDSTEINIENEVENFVSNFLTSK